MAKTVYLDFLYQMCNWLLINDKLVIFMTSNSQRRENRCVRTFLPCKLVFVRCEAHAIFQTQGIIYKLAIGKVDDLSRPKKPVDATSNGTGSDVIIR